MDKTARLVRNSEHQHFAWTWKSYEFIVYRILALSARFCTSGTEVAHHFTSQCQCMTGAYWGPLPPSKSDIVSQLFLNYLSEIYTPQIPSEPQPPTDQTRPPDPGWVTSARWRNGSATMPCVLQQRLCEISYIRCINVCHILNLYMYHMLNCIMMSYIQIDALYIELLAYYGPSYYGRSGCPHRWSHDEPTTTPAPDRWPADSEQANSWLIGVPKSFKIYTFRDRKSVV